MVKYWIFPTNIKKYDIKNAFNELNEIDWEWDGKPQGSMKEILFIVMLQNHIAKFCIKQK